jgi:hypothetical protein
MPNQHRTARTPAERARLLTFKPVPRERVRADGWSPERQQAFIEALADSGCVTRAAGMVGMAPEGAYALRRHRGGKSFAEAWDRAQDVGVQRLRDIAFERAIEGVPVPVYYKGEQVGERRWYNDRLLMFILRHHDPDRYGSGSPAGRLSPATVNKLRAEWERERAIEAAGRTEEDRERLADQLRAIHERLMAGERIKEEQRRIARHERRLAERAALGLPGPIDPLNLRPPLAPEVPSPWAKPGYEYPKGHGPEGKLLLPPPPAIRNL